MQFSRFQAQQNGPTIAALCVIVCVRVEGELGAVAVWLWEKEARLVGSRVLVSLGLSSLCSLQGCS